jgi:prevent-host-death family protein
MAMIGVRELRQQTSEVLRKVKEERTEYIITYQGQPVAILLPLDAEAVEAAILRVGREAAAARWDAYDETAARVRAAWPKDYDSQSLLDEIRR